MSECVCVCVCVCIMYYVLCIMYYVLCIMYYVLCILLHVSVYVYFYMSSINECCVFLLCVLCLCFACCVVLCLYQTLATLYTPMKPSFSSTLHFVFVRQPPQCPPRFDSLLIDSESNLTLWLLHLQPFGRLLCFIWFDSGLCRNYQRSFVMSRNHAINAMFLLCQFIGFC